MTYRLLHRLTSAALKATSKKEQLAISRVLVRALGKAIEVESAKPKPSRKLLKLMRQSLAVSEAHVRGEFELEPEQQ